MITDQQEKELYDLADKLIKANKYYDNLIEMNFVQLPFLTKKLVNQCGADILKILTGRAKEKNVSYF